MDYYYSLLESYELLKRRKFKLSIREEDQPLTTVNNPEDIIQKMTDGKDGDEISFQHPNGENKVTATIKSSRGKGGMPGTPYIRVKFGQEGGAVPIALAGGEEPTKSQAGPFKKNLEKLEAWFNQPGAGDGTPKLDTGAPDHHSRDMEALDDHTIQLDQTMTDQIDTALNQLDSMRDNEAVDFFPGLEDKGLRKPSSLGKVIEGKAQGWGGDREAVHSQLFNTPDKVVTRERRAEALVSLNESLRVLQDIHDGGWDTDEGATDGSTGLTETDVLRLRGLAGDIKIHPMGISFKGVFFFYRQGSDSKNDVLRNMVDQLNDTIDAYNSQFAGIKDEDKRRDAEIKRIPKAVQTGTGGVSESWRGPVAEKIMRVSAITAKSRLLFQQAKTPGEKRKILAQHRQKLADVYEAALEDGSLKQLQEVFALGNSVLLQEIVGDLETMDKAAYVQACKHVLMERGMSEEEAQEMIDMAGDDRTMGMALIVGSFANQNFDQELFGDEVDLIPDDIEHSGTDAMTSYGEKEDARFYWDGENCKKVKEHYTKLLGDLTDRYKGACGTEGNDAWAGSEKMMQATAEGQCMLGVEPKTLTSSKSTFGSGNISLGRSGALCKDEELTYPSGAKKGEPDVESMNFHKLHTERLDGCLGEGTYQRACKKLGEIQGEADKIINTLQPGKGVIGVPGSKVSSLDLWWSNKNQKDEKMKARYDAAKRALNKKPPDPKDLKQLKKVQRDIFQAVLRRDMPQGELDPSNPDHREWIDFLTSQYHLGTGTDREMLRIGRGLEDGYQGVYLNNAEVAKNMTDIRDGKAKWSYDGGGTIHLVQEHEAEVFEPELIDTKGLTGKELEKAEKKNEKAKERAEIDSRRAKREGKAAHSPVKIDTGRGEWKYSVPKHTYKEIGEGDEMEEPSSTEEDILVAFLRGQQQLLEKILTQTN